MARNERNALLEDVDIIFRNFAGKEGQYNRAGDRNFSVKLDPDVAERMLADGWNVKFLKGREEGEPDQAYIPVSVSYKNRPPKVVMITSRGRNPIGEDMIEMLDWVDIKTVDLILNPYEWVVNGKAGVKAYLQTLFITIDEDPLELKYNSLPDASSRPLELESNDDGARLDYDFEGEVVD
jgi:hypothetical protein